MFLGAARRHCHMASCFENMYLIYNIYTYVLCYKYIFTKIQITIGLKRIML